MVAVPLQIVSMTRESQEVAGQEEQGESRGAEGGEAENRGGLSEWAVSVKTRDAEVAPLLGWRHYPGESHLQGSEWCGPPPECLSYTDMKTKQGASWVTTVCLK